MNNEVNQNVNLEPKGKKKSALTIVLSITTVLAIAGILVFGYLLNNKAKEKGSGVTTTATKEAVNYGDIEKYKAAIAGKTSEDKIVLLDDSFVEIGSFDRFECSVDGQKISKNVKNHKVELTCVVSTDSPDFKSFEGTIDGVPFNTYFEGIIYKNNDSVIVYSNGQDGYGYLEIFYKGSTESVRIAEIANNENTDDGDYEGVTPFIKDNVLYYAVLTRDLTGFDINKVDFNEATYKSTLLQNYVN